MTDATKADDTAALVRILREISENERCNARRFQKCGETDTAEICLVHAHRHSQSADTIERLSADLAQAKRERDGALAPVAWLYHNEDTGIEISRQHPIDSGEVPDATDVAPLHNEAAYLAIIDAWENLDTTEQALAAARAEADRLREAHTATAARFERLAGICRRLWWHKIGVPAMRHDDTRAALSDLCEWLVAEGIDGAIEAHAATELGGASNG